MRQELVSVRVANVLVRAALDFTNASNVSLPVTEAEARLSNHPSNSYKVTGVG